MVWESIRFSNSKIGYQVLEPNIFAHLLKKIPYLLSLNFVREGLREETTSKTPIRKDSHFFLQKTDQKIFIFGQMASNFVLSTFFCVEP